MQKLIFFLSLLGVGPVSAVPLITQLPLDERMVQTIPVVAPPRSGVTTVSFPGPIAGLESDGLAVDNLTAGEFTISFRPSQNYFALRAKSATSKTNLNVVYRGKIYVLQLEASADPRLEVNFTPPGEEPPSRTTAVSAGRLLNCLDLAKAYPFLEMQHAELIAAIEHASPKTIVPYRDFDIRIDDVFRFNEEDTVIFHLTLLNRADREIHYNREDLAVRVGAQLYTESISDGTGVMPLAQRSPDGKTMVPSESTAWFAITGTSTGGRNELSVHNDWKVILPVSVPSTNSQP